MSADAGPPQWGEGGRGGGKTDEPCASLFLVSARGGRVQERNVGVGGRTVFATAGGCT